VYSLETILILSSELQQVVTWSRDTLW
jgi:hypothetical protein